MKCLWVWFCVLFVLSGCGSSPTAYRDIGSLPDIDDIDARSDVTCETLRDNRPDIILIDETAMMTIPPCREPLSDLADGGDGLLIFDSSHHPGGEPLTPEGKPVRIAGELWLPKGKGEGPFPTVIYMPSIRGYDQEIRNRRHLYLQRGWAYFALDPFSGRRGRPSGICQTAVIDAYRALELLSTHPRIMASHVAISGYSCGGMTAQLTSYEPVRHALLEKPLSFRAHVAKGPFCNVHRDGENGVSYGPGALLVAMGEFDYLSTPDHCDRLVRDFRKSGGSAELVILAGASHDLSGSTPLRYDRDQISWHHCEMSVGADGSMRDQQGRPFHRTHCYRYGGYVGSRQAQWAAIDAAEFDFLSRHLRE